MNKFRITYPNNKEVQEYKSRTTNNNYPSYSNLPDNYHGEDGLKEILEGYRDFLKYIISNKKLLH